MRRLLKIVPLLLALGACGGARVVPRASAPEAPTQGLTKCSVAASRTSPLVTEWPASEKANLEVRLREGAVAVSYSGCEMRLVPECHVGGGYQWLRTTVASDAIEISNEDELYAKLPLGAVSLEGELRSSGRLAMQTTVTGQVRLSGVAVADLKQSEECAAATHLLTAMTIGAFKLRSGGTLKAGATVTAPIVDGGASTESSERLLREAGDGGRCSESTDAAPHPDCRSPIQMFLAPLPWTRGAEVPAGMKRVEFASAGGGVVWEVYAGGTPLCTTPCTRDVAESAAFLMKESKESFPPRTWPEIEVPSLSGETSANELVVRAHPTSMGMVATGIVFTALGGAAVVAGIPLLSIGLAKDDDGFTNAGLGAGIPGLAVVTGSIVLLAYGRSYPEIEERAGIDVGPGYLRGSF